MNAYQITLIGVGLIGLLGFFVFWGFLTLSDRYGTGLSRRTREAVKIAVLSEITFFVCVVVTVILQDGESWLGEVRYLPWIISGVPLALIFGYIARRQAETLLYVAEHPKLRIFLSSVTYILLLDWVLISLTGSAFAVIPDAMPEIPTGSAAAILERIPLLAPEVICLAAISVVFWKSGEPRTPSSVLRIRNKLFSAGTMCWLVVELIEMSFPLTDAFLAEREAVFVSSVLTLMQALILALSIVFWLLGFIKHRSRTDLDIWRERFLEWSRLREMLGIARAKIRFQSNRVLMTHEYHLSASAKCLGLSEDDRRKAILTLHMTCVLSEATSHDLFYKRELRVQREDLLKCATLQDHLRRSNAISSSFELRLTDGSDRASYGLRDDLLYEVLRPTLWITQIPLQTDISRCPLWTQLAALSAAHAGLLAFDSQQKIFTSRKLHSDVVSTYKLSMDISSRERI